MSASNLTETMQGCGVHECYGNGREPDPTHVAAYIVIGLSFLAVVLRLVTL